MNKAVEIFDEVDESNQVIGKTYKAEAHQKGLIHRVAAIFIFDDTGNLLVQVHEEGGGILDHTVGGHVRSGESYDDGARREMQEEVGLDVPTKRIGVIYSDETYTGSQFRHMYALYSAHAPKDWRFMPNQEVKKLLSISLRKVLDMMAKQPRDFTAGFLSCMQFYCKEVGLDFSLDLNQYKKSRRTEA